MKNKYIVIDGLDGVGKTTCAKLLADEIGGVYFCSPPSIISPIRDILDTSSNPNARFLFYLMGNLLGSDIISEYLKDSSVISDRGIISTICFHEPLGVTNAHTIASMFDILYPTMQVVLTCDTHIRRQRLESRGSPKTSSDHWLNDMSYEKSVINGFKQLSDIHFLDTTDKRPEEVVKDIISLL